MVDVQGSTRERALWTSLHSNVARQFMSCSDLLLLWLPIGMLLAMSCGAATGPLLQVSSCDGLLPATKRR